MAVRRVPWPASCPPAPDGLGGQLDWLFVAIYGSDKDTHALDDEQWYPYLTRGEALSVTIALRDALRARGEAWPFARDLVAAQMDSPRPGLISYTTADRGKLYRYPARIWAGWRDGAAKVRAIEAGAPLELPSPTKAWCAAVAKDATEAARRDAGGKLGRKLPDPDKMFPLPRMPRVGAGAWLAIAVIAVLAFGGD